MPRNHMRRWRLRRPLHRNSWFNDLDDFDESDEPSTTYEEANLKNETPVLRPNQNEELISENEIFFSGIEPSETSEDDTVEGPVDFRLFSIHGLSGKHVELGESTLAGLAAHCSFDFENHWMLSGQDVLNGVRTAAIELLDMVLKELSDFDEQESLALMFIAQDIGGIVLKQALYEASKNNDKYGRIISNTTHLFFIATPHRASVELPWRLSLSNILNHRMQRISDAQEFLNVTQLAIVHENLCTKFELICQAYSFQIINCYQETSASDTYKTVVPKKVAIIDQGNELTVGRHAAHDELADLSHPKIQNILLSAVHNAHTQIKPSYRTAIDLLSIYNLDIPLSRDFEPNYQSLCNLIFSTEGLESFVNGIHPRTTVTVSTSTPATDEQDKHKSFLSPQSIRRCFRQIELGQLNLYMDSFIKTLRRFMADQILEHQGPVQLIILTHHPSHQTPMTKANLLASVARQYLKYHPRAFDQVSDLFQQLQVALSTFNTAWIESILWRIVRSLLAYKPNGQMFVLVFQPLEEILASPFSRLLVDISSWLLQAESSCKFLVFRCAHYWSDAPATHHSQETSAYSLAVQEDHNAAIRVTSQDVSDGAIVREYLSGFSDTACFPTLDPYKQSLNGHVLASLVLADKEWLSNMGRKAIVELIFESIAKPIQSAVKTGVVWITHAIRPLTFDQLASVMHPDGFGFNTSGNGCATDALIRQFQTLLCGLVETHGNKIHLANSFAATLLSWKLKKPQEQYNPHSWLNPTNKAQSEAESPIPDHLSAHAHLDIARYCITLLEQHFNINPNKEYIAVESEIEEKKNTEVSPEREAFALQSEMSTSPLLPYAAQYWPIHIQFWIDNAENANDDSHTSHELEFVANFFSDHILMNKWLRLRNALNGKTIQHVPQFDVLDIAKKLNVDFSKGSTLSKLINIVQCASEIDAGDNQSYYSSIVIALAQQGDIEALARMSDNEFHPLSLNQAFSTGSDSALCYIAKRFPDFVTQNKDNLILQALRLGNTMLLDSLCDDEISSHTYAEPCHLIIHKLAENDNIVPSERVWRRLKRHCGAISDDKKTAFHVAALSGNYAIIPRLVTEGVDMNKQDSSGATALLLAVKYGHFKVATQLLAAKANPSLGDKAGQTPLHVACENDRFNIVKILTGYHRFQINVNAKDRKKKTALHHALANNRRDIAMLILQSYLGANIIFRYKRQLEGPQGSKGHMSICLTSHDTSFTTTSTLHEKTDDFMNTLTYPSEKFVLSLSEVAVSTVWRTKYSLDPNVRNCIGETPLMLAVKEGNEEAVRYLLRYEAKLRILHGNAKSPLHHAAALDTPTIIRLLLEASDADMNQRDINGATPLHIAAAKGSIKVLEELMERSAEINVKDKLGHSPLDLACKRGSVTAVRMMLRSSNLETITSGFLEAVTENQAEIVELLLDAGADKNATTASTGCTALHIAVSNSNARVLHALLVRNVQLNSLNKSGRTPLHEAASIGAISCLKLLINAGAEIDRVDSSDTTALITAANANFESCVAILLDAKASISFVSPVGNLIEVALSTFKPDMFQRLIQRLESDNGRTWSISDDALRTFLREGEDVTTKLGTLFNHGLSRDREIGEKGTILQYATAWDKLDLVEMILNSNHTTPNGVPLYYDKALREAVINIKPNSPEIVRMLLKAGADAKQEIDDKGTILHYASHKNRSPDDEYFQIARNILQHAPDYVNIISGKYQTVLVAAISGGTFEILGLILDYNPKLGPYGPFDTPLHLAAFCDLTEEARFMLKHENTNLAIDATDQEGRLPLHLVRYDSPIYGLLSNDQVIPTTPDLQQRHLFHFCALHGSERLLSKVLKSYPGSIHDTDLDGWTPLHWACRRDNLRVIKLLLKNGARKNDITKRGWRPLDVATYHNVNLEADAELERALQPDENLDIAQDRYPLIPGPQIADEEVFPVKRAQCPKSVSCDSCLLEPVYGPRYNCRNCADYDLCFKCFRHARLFHDEGHRFDWYDEDENLVMQNINPWL